MRVCLTPPTTFDTWLSVSGTRLEKCQAEAKVIMEYWTLEAPGSKQGQEGVLGLEQLCRAFWP